MEYHEDQGHLQKREGVWIKALRTIEPCEPHFMPYHTYYHCSCQVICVTYSHAVSPSGYNDVQNRSTFLVTIVAYNVCMVRVFFVCISCQACCVSTLLCWQNYMEHFPPTLSWFASVAWIAKCEWPVLGWILFLWVLPHHSPPPHSQLWAPCTEHDEFL